MNMLPGIFSRSVLFCCAIAWFALRTAAAAPVPALYVSDERGGVVLALDASSGEVRARIPVGKRPRGLRLSPNGRQLYVALSGSAIGGPGVDESTLPPPDRTADGIGVIDIASHSLRTLYPSGPDPETFDISADGKTIFIGNEDAMRLSALDVATGTIRGSVQVGVEPEGVTLSPDGKRVYVACEGTGNVFAIDTVSLREVGQIAAQSRPRNVAFTRDGKLGFITNEIDASLTVFDPATNSVRTTLALGSDQKLVLPMAMALSPDGKRLYVTTGRGGSLIEIDITTLQVKRTMTDIGMRPWGVAISADGRTAYTANGPGGDVSFVDLTTGKVRKRIKVGVSPWGLVLAH